ncbi:MAG TPA: CapA family protein [Hyphomicrobiaceae bacterium]|nr:CapA family protein [Hyphomicrobiaceae bacterium]
MPAQPKVELLFVGDIYGGYKVAHVSKGIRDIAAKADLVSINVESPLTDHDTPFRDKTIYLKNSPATLTVLRELSTDIACLANNHACDWGGKGLADTRRLLAENSIAAVGAGRDLGEAEAPVIVERRR